MADKRALGACPQDAEAARQYAFEAYRQDIQAAETARQRAIAGELAHHRSALDDIEASYRSDVAAAQHKYRADGWTAAIFPAHGLPPAAQRR